jgi:ATP dependent DNA ligase domain
MVDTHDGFRARSRRGWAMAVLVPELQAMPEGLQLDGELVSFDQDGRPSFDLLGRRMLMRDRRVPVCFLAFDVLAVEGVPTLEQPYQERAILEALEFAGPYWATVPSFDDAGALWSVVTAQQLEGVVAKRLRDPYVPGDSPSVGQDEVGSLAAAGTASGRRWRTGGGRHSSACRGRFHRQHRGRCDHRGESHCGGKIPAFLAGHFLAGFAVLAPSSLRGRRPDPTPARWPRPSRWASFG